MRLFILTSLHKLPSRSTCVMFNTGYVRQSNGIHDSERYVMTAHRSLCMGGWVIGCVGGNGV